MATVMYVVVNEYHKVAHAIQGLCNALATSVNSFATSNFFFKKVFFLGDDIIRLPDKTDYY